jgi:hypothetical protein
MSNEKNVHQRLIGVMAEMGAIGKGGSTSYGEKFAYHKIDDIDDKLRQSLISNGLVAYISEIRDRKLEYVAEESRGGKLTWYAECLVLIEIVNVDKPDDKVTIVGWGQGLDYSDKATGKAISYAAKAAYLSAFHLRGQPDSEQDAINRLPANRPESDTKPSPAIQAYIDSINGMKKLSDLLTYGEILAKEEQSVRIHPEIRAAWGARKKALEKAEAEIDF